MGNETSHSPASAQDWADEFDKIVGPKIILFPNNDTTCFRILTWNVWFSEFEQKSRMFSLLFESIVENKCDILCFQEVTPVFHETMMSSEFIREHYVCAEDIQIALYDVTIWTKRDIPLIKQTVLNLPSYQGRRCLVVDVDLSSRLPPQCPESQRPFYARIATVHLESMKENYELRAQQLQIILPALVSTDFCESIFLTGDFNFCSSWTEENEILDAHPCIKDVWNILRPNESGYTEDSDVNQMMKISGKVKHVRFDRILQLRPAERIPDDVNVDPPRTPPPNPPPPNPMPVAVGSVVCTPISIDIVGTARVASVRKTVVFPSDHFGVVGSFKVEVST